MLQVKKPIITVKQARKLWGSESKNYTDEQIRKLLFDYETLARQAVREYLARKQSTIVL